MFFSHDEDKEQSLGNGVKMNLIIKSFEELTTTELYEILRVRAEVFVVEQDCVYQDLDGLDYNSMHVFLEQDGKVQAYLRVFLREEKEKVVQIGRVLTYKRGAGLGLELLLQGIEVAKSYFQAKKLYLEAQVYAIGFYEKAGFKVVSEEFLEDGIPHVCMELGR